MPEGFRTREDAGDVYLFPEGDTSVPPSGHMPAGGYFFDAIVRQGPIDEAKLDPADNCEEFKPLSPADLDHWRRELARVRGETRAVVGGIGGMAFGDIALVPAVFLKHPKGIRDVGEWYISLADRRDYVHRIFDYQCEVALRNLATFAAIEQERLLENATVVGDYLKAGLASALAGTAGILEVRGQGLMVGIELEKPCGVLVSRALDAGLLINVTRDRVVRLLPPLILSKEEADQIIKILVPLIKTFIAEKA